MQKQSGYLNPTRVLSHSIYKSYLVTLSSVLERGFNFLADVKNKMTEADCISAHKIKTAFKALNTILSAQRTDSLKSD